MMKAINFLVVVAVLAVVCDGKINTPATHQSLTQDAHMCCVSSTCSAEQKAAIRDKANTYDGPNVQETKNFIERALSGEACANTGRSKRAAGDYANVTCNGPFDVQNGPVEVTCTLSARLLAGIYSAQLTSYITLLGSTRYYYPDNYYYYDNNATSTTLSRTYIIKLPQYAANGTYVVSAYAYPLSGAGVTSTTNFTVLKTKNDVLVPVLTSLSPSVMNFNDDNKAFAFTASDDLSGVVTVYVYVRNNSHSVGYGYWNAPYNYQTGNYAGLRSVSSAAPLYLYPDTAPGIYQLEVYLGDAINSNAYVSTYQLASMNMTSTLALATNNCPNGTYRAYNTTGSCTACPAGTYAKAGSFRCSTCPPGTSSTAIGASACTPCPAGYSGIGASWACAPCYSGQYSYSGAAFCIPCQPGYNQTATGSTSCGYCPPGTYSTGGATTCTPCPVGTFSYGYSSYCNKCTPGTFNNVIGASACSTCPSGTYSGLGQSSCAACPAPRVFSNANSGSQLECYEK